MNPIADTNSDEQGEEDEESDRAQVLPTSNKVINKPSYSKTTVKKQLVRKNIKQLLQQ